jgi:SAM-dependent methyltransferase
MNSIFIAKLIMKMFETKPCFSDTQIGVLTEVFNHKTFLHADDSKKKSIMLKSSKSKYENELQYPWDNYFGFNLKPFLQGKVALDLGCFTGGRSVAWFENYGLRQISGVDIKEVYITAAKQFGAMHNVKSDFRIGWGESLPFENEMFDAILTFDVFEHVQDVRKTLRECNRVLKVGGKLFLVFPSYFQPIEHHLSLVTRIPCIHWFFSGETLVKAYCNILEERDDAYWYKRSSAELESWEKCNTINGTTLFFLKKLIRDENWRIMKEIRKPIGSIGRNISKHAFVKSIGSLFLPFLYIPGLQELLIHRITFILEKK